ncbi:MAG: type restriction enzyme subunit [Bacteroidales bacterium]|nr:type restriction enzyme subunit [Bacteroidales bacterium]
MGKTPEQIAREKIDQMLISAGWVVQDMKDINLGASLGVIVREYPTETGPADYIMFVNRNPVGVIEAKKEGTILTTVEEQSERYATSGLKWNIDQQKLPFIYESTGVITRFTDNRDPVPRSREIFHFHRPETLEELVKQENSFRYRLRNDIPVLNPEGLRACQVNAITRLEKSFAENKPRALIQMATGSGKTFTAITSVYRLLKFAHAKRILFLVDTKNLGEQAEQEFQAYKPNDDKRKFTELYTVQRLSSSYINQSSQVCISTIQRMYSILKGEELDETAEEHSLNEIKLNNENPKEVVYNPDVPIETFDVIIIDECHRSIYNLWKQVLDYFDALLIGLTATPDNRTFAFFHENVVSEYTHEEAIADGVNVGYDIYTIETEITQNGAKIDAKQFVDFRSKLTRKKRWGQLDEEEEYTGRNLDRNIVNPSQIRQVIRTFKEKLLTEIFPNRKEVPKTLIFAKTDSHADDIIQIVREEFGEGNQFCKKITYKIDEDPKSLLASFRNAYYPRIAVTVDMIATGTDVKPLEVLLFMRDVKSRNYFEQMKGRGTRTYRKDDLQKVTPSAVSNKTHFVIVDAIGVCKSVKTESRALERKKSVPLKDLVMNVMMNNRDEDTYTSLAGRLGRIEKQMTPEEKNQFKAIAGGKSIHQVTHELLNAYNPDCAIEETKAKYPETVNLDEQEIPAERVEESKQELINKAGNVFTGELLQYIEKVKTAHEQIIDTVNLDKVNFAGFSDDMQEKAKETIKSFEAFIEANKDEIIALRIFYDQPYKRRKFSYQMIKELRGKLLQSKPNLSIMTVWEAYKRLENKQISNPATELTALVALVRRAIGLDTGLTRFESTVNNNFKQWVFTKNAGNVQFSKEQMEWLRMMKDYIATSMNIEKDDFDNEPFAEKGGLMKVWNIFGDQLEDIVEELNVELIA